MPFSLFPFFRRKPKAPPPQALPQIPPKSAPAQSPPKDGQSTIARHFFNERGFQTYASFFAHWDGWITAGHVLDDCGHALPPFVQNDAAGRCGVEKWPTGLDAALLGCTVPAKRPLDPRAGQAVCAIGFPAGSAHAARRSAKVYLERPGAPGIWIARITEPDEPVVSGMSGGMVQDEKTGAPIGILITRNSPADLNNDRDPDESFDFVALSAVWDAVQGAPLIA